MAKNPNRMSERLIKIVLVGDSDVGKSTIFTKFINETPSHTMGSIGSPEVADTAAPDFRNKSVDYGGKPVRLQVWDTVGQERFNTITSSYYRGASGVVLVFDLSREETFQHVTLWDNDMRKFGGDTVHHKILVGNKSDLPRVVSEEAALKLAEELGYGYIETCALQNTNINEAFMNLVAKMKGPITASEPSLGGDHKPPKGSKKGATITLTGAGGGSKGAKMFSRCVIL
eukprot:TRINITY_DN977_c0_g1_i1.p1 TRINITY_DN977_c0_g1~~TRINITY_DN977_c0_g1_i1.p1  ORF type:complete len:229 (-),score=18.52 TRINITY_DN977_c0_g1_i1:27-713(-)